MAVWDDSETYHRKRIDMVENQIQKRGIIDQRLLTAMRKIPRHLFIPAHQRDRAYDDCPLPIGENQTISQPYIVALMTAHLELAGDEKVLELGTGSGYQAAILCELADTVISVERIAKLARRAEKDLSDAGYTNFRVIVGDGTEGFHPEAPYDRVMITAATPEIPHPVVEQMREGGIIVAPVGMQFEQDLLKGVKKEGALKKRYLGGCRFVKLVGKYGFKGP